MTTKVSSSSSSWSMTNHHNHPPQSTIIKSRQNVTSTNDITSVVSTRTELGDIYTNSAASQAYQDQALNSHDDDDEQKISLVFKNDTPERLLLCWIASNGTPHHFYVLEPCQSMICHTRKNGEYGDGDGGVVMNVRGAHLETTQLGHAFVLARMTDCNALADHMIKQQEKIAKNDDDGNTEKNAKLDPEMIVAGYRPRFYTLANEESSTITKRKSQGLCAHMISISRCNPSKTPSSSPKAFFHRKVRTPKKSWTQQQQHENWKYHLIVTQCSLDTKPIDTSNKSYIDTKWGGWPIKCESDLYSKLIHTHKQHKDLLAIQKRIRQDLSAAFRLLPRKARKLLITSHSQHRTPIWINDTQKYGPQCAPITGKGMCFHPNQEWLIRNGLTPEKHGGIEMYNIRDYGNHDCHLWGKGGIMLHELYHAYHWKCIKNGYQNAEIRECYRRAMKEGLYDCVRVHEKGTTNVEGGATAAPILCYGRRKAYACTNPEEYFAELSTAFLGGIEEDGVEFNKWFPFNRRQIRQHDPRAYRMLKKMWGVKIDDDEVI